MSKQSLKVPSKITRGSNMLFWPQSVLDSLTFFSVISQQGLVSLALSPFSTASLPWEFSITFLWRTRPPFIGFKEIVSQSMMEMNSWINRRCSTGLLLSELWFEVWITCSWSAWLLSHLNMRRWLKSTKVWSPHSLRLASFLHQSCSTLSMKRSWQAKTWSASF